MCATASAHQVPARCASLVALGCQQRCCGCGLAVDGNGSPAVVGLVHMESSAIYAGCACSACAAAWPVCVVYVGWGGAGEAASSAVIVGAGLVAGLAVVRSSPSVLHCSGLVEAG